MEGEISFTFDTWTSEGSDNFISVTAHYIDSPTDQPDQWTLKEDQLAFTLLEGHHTGENIASVLASIIERYDIREKVFIELKYIPLTSADCLLLVVRMVYSRQRIQQ